MKSPGSPVTRLNVLMCGRSAHSRKQHDRWRVGREQWIDIGRCGNLRHGYVFKLPGLHNMTCINLRPCLVGHF